MINLKPNRIYIVKDAFFNEFNDPYLTYNKNENRPHGIVFKDPNPKLSELFWIIPMGSNIQKYREKIDYSIKNRGNCDFWYIDKIGNKQSVFLICNMFPIIPRYIKREYTINKIPLEIKNKKTIKEINKRAKKVHAKIHHNRKSMPETLPDVLSIKQKLLNSFY
jgi:hypothetical protein